MNRNDRLSLTAMLLIGILATSLVAQTTAPATGPAGRGRGAAPAQEDDNGARTIDYSYAGYKAGAVAIPDLPVRVVVKPVAGDNTERIQAAIDFVASLPEAERGAVLLSPGKFQVSGGLFIRASNVVLRGSGTGENGTLLVAAGYDRRALITIQGKDDRAFDNDGIPIVDRLVQVGAQKVTVGNTGNLKVGDTITIRRPSTAAWIRMLDVAGDTASRWRPGSRDIVWDRVVAGIDGNTVTLDAPLTNALEGEYGSMIWRYTWPGRVSNVGVENLRCESDFDQANPKDEDHAWYGVAMQNVRDGWVRRISFSHLAGGAVWVYESCKQVTVRDCKSLAPVSELANTRRQTFFTGGTLTLFLHCYSEQGRHDFSTDLCAPGPNAFVQCEGVDAQDSSGPIDSWATGVLYDNVRLDNAIVLSNRGREHQFVGWCAANCMLWQCSASVYRCASPPTARNWANGCWGSFDGNGLIRGTGEFVKPVSLYFGQLGDRIGPSANQISDWMNVPTDSYTNPPPEKAATAIAASVKPADSLADFIDAAQDRRAMPIDPAGAKTFEDIARPPNPAAPIPWHKMSIVDGRIVTDGTRLLAGGYGGVKYWRGDGDDLPGQGQPQRQTSLVRFVPGRNSPGATDDLSELIASIAGNNIAIQEHHYALWYDRRNDDHERVKRLDADCWPPFYELPFQRSGQGTAWDGLSKYDLTKYDHFYFDRVRKFAELCEMRGMVMLDDHFFQHNILEAGAHWASCPWRSSNNINSTGFPEPPPFAGDKRIFMAEQFYDVTHPARREIYKAYIRQVLSNHAGQSNVIHLTSAEYSGPLHFVQFWLDTIGEWQKETGKAVTVGLAAPKDVQDAILADPVRAKLVSVIFIRYWWYQSDGKTYAPPGGKNLSPRQWMRMGTKPSSVAQVVRAVREYRDKYPDKAVVYSPFEGDAFGWAALMAGGSLPHISAKLDDGFATAVAKMKPAEAPEGQCILADNAGNSVVYATNPLALNPSKPGYATHVIDLATGQMTQGAPNGPALVWFERLR